MKMAKIRTKVEIKGWKDLFKRLVDGERIYTSMTSTAHVRVNQTAHSDAQYGFSLNTLVNFNTLYSEVNVPWYELESEFPKVVKVSATGGLVVVIGKVYDKGIAVLDSRGTPYEISEIELLTEEEFLALR